MFEGLFECLKPDARFPCCVYDFSSHTKHCMININLEVIFRINRYGVIIRFHFWVKSLEPGWGARGGAWILWVGFLAGDIEV